MSDPACYGIAGYCILAAETAQLAQKLPDRAAIKVTVRVAIKNKHFANLLLLFVSRGQEDCNRFVTFYQAVNIGNDYLGLDFILNKKRFGL